MGPPPGRYPDGGQDWTPAVISLQVTVGAHFAYGLPQRPSRTHFNLGTKHLPMLKRRKCATKCRSAPKKACWSGVTTCCWRGAWWELAEGPLQALQGCWSRVGLTRVVGQCWGARGVKNGVKTAGGGGANPKGHWTPLLTLSAC